MDVLHRHGCPLPDAASDGIEIGFLDGFPREVILEHRDSDETAAVVFWRPHANGTLVAVRQVPLVGARVPVRRL